MSLGALMLQNYPFGLYQSGTQSPDPKNRLIQPPLLISYSPFISKELLTLERLLLPSGTPTNITILDDSISSIHCISQLPSMSLISDQFPMDNHQNIYILPIEYEEHPLASSSIQIIQVKQKIARYSSVMLTLVQRHSSALTFLEEHRIFFY